MLKLKGCPKCKGDMVIDRDIYGRYEQCLQCGYLNEIGEICKVATGTKEVNMELVQVR